MSDILKCSDWTVDGPEDIDVYSGIPLQVYPVYNEKNKEDISEEDREIGRKFKIPEVGIDLIDFFFTKEDKNLILNLKASVFSKDSISPEYLEDAFHRGIISKTDESGNDYELSDFYSLLDTFSVAETERYRTLTMEKRKELDDWYFEEYMHRLDPDFKNRPTSDVVVTLEEMLDYIDRQENQPYLNYCDCKSLTGACGLPSHTCINYVHGINGWPKRGISIKISKEQAKDIVRKADRTGLIHTISDHGLCNCCGDCCYLFRGQKYRKSVGFWPESPYIISMDSFKCISCGKCVKRCHFKVFEKTGEGRTAKIYLNNSTCVGCGLCQNTCPTGALKLVARDESLMEKG